MTEKITDDVIDAEMAQIIALANRVGKFLEGQQMDHALKACLWVAATLECAITEDEPPIEPRAAQFGGVAAAVLQIVQGRRVARLAAAMPQGNA